MRRRTVYTEDPTSAAALKAKMRPGDNEGPSYGGMTIAAILKRRSRKGFVSFRKRAHLKGASRRHLGSFVKTEKVKALKRMKLNPLGNKKSKQPKAEGPSQPRNGHTKLDAGTSKKKKAFKLFSKNSKKDRGAERNSPARRNSGILSPDDMENRSRLPVDSTPRDAVLADVEEDKVLLEMNLGQDGSNAGPQSNNSQTEPLEAEEATTTPNVAQALSAEEANPTPVAIQDSTLEEVGPSPAAIQASNSEEVAPAAAAIQECNPVEPKESSGSVEACDADAGNPNVEEIGTGVSNEGLEQEEEEVLDEAANKNSEASGEDAEEEEQHVAEGALTQENYATVNDSKGDSPQTTEQEKEDDRGDIGDQECCESSGKENVVAQEAESCEAQEELTEQAASSPGNLEIQTETLSEPKEINRPVMKLQQPEPSRELERTRPTMKLRGQPIRDGLVDRNRPTMKLRAQPGETEDLEKVRPTMKLQAEEKQAEEIVLEEGQTMQLQELAKPESFKGEQPNLDHLDPIAPIVETFNKKPAIVREKSGKGMNVMGKWVNMNGKWLRVAMVMEERGMLDEN